MSQNTDRVAITRRAGGFALAALFVRVAIAPVAIAANRPMTFEDRVEAQHAIEEVYWRHRVSPADNPEGKPALADVLTTAAMEKKVEDYLKKSFVLESMWGRPITGADLQSELERMSSNTRAPEVLGEIFAALDHDPQRIAETLARQVLAERLSRELHLNDERIPGEVPKIEFDAWCAKVLLDAPASVNEPVFTYTLPKLGATGTEAEFAAIPAPVTRDQTSVWTGSTTIVWGGSEVSGEVNTGAVCDPTTKLWHATPTAGAPAPRSHHTAVWTGTEMIVWGGADAGGELSSGGKYIPATDSWSATSIADGVPTARQQHGAVWTGTQMIVFGGRSGSTFIGTASAYDPASDAWTALDAEAVRASVRTGAGRSDHDVAVYSRSGGSAAEANPLAVPQILYPPTPQTTTFGGLARFTVIASGTSPLSYQWRRDGSPLSDGGVIGGATSDTLTLTGAGSSDAASYSVVVSNESGSATSGDAELTVSGVPQGGDVDLTFDTGSTVNDFIFAIATQTDGKIVIGGVFTRVHDVPRGRVARLNADGTTDHTFANGLEGANGEVDVVAVQPDGKVLIGGNFTTVNGATRIRIARLNLDGSTDPSFQNGLSGADAPVYALAVQADGKVVIGGEFTTINGASSLRIARLNPDGSIDTTFANGLAAADGTIRALAVQPDGKVLMGGDFITVNGMERHRTARLNPDGSLDLPLAGANGTVYALAMQPDGFVVIGGDFNTVNGTGRNRIARINANGTHDTTFLNGLAGANVTVRAIAAQSDGKVLIAGDFTTVNGMSRARIARLNGDGSLDATFLSGLTGANATVRALLAQPDGKIAIVGHFATVNGVSRKSLARVEASGATELNFRNGPEEVDSAVQALAVQPDGKVLVGGGFVRVNGVSRGRIARLNSDSSVDTAFMNGLTGANGGVLAIAVQSDQKVLIAGTFAMVNGVSRGRVARLNADGSTDTTFLNGLAGANNSVRALAVQSDGKVVIGGDFTTVNGVSRGRIARLNADGTLDTGFLNGLSGISSGHLNALAVQPDGKILIGGSFGQVNTSLRNHLARLNADGSVDVPFLSGQSGVQFGGVYALVLQSDGKVLLGGSIDWVNGQSRHGIARLHPSGSVDTTFMNGLPGTGLVWTIAVQVDGKVLIGGDFSTVNGVSRGGVARLNSNGTTDTTFGNGLAGANGTVYALAVQPNAMVLIGGSFTTVNGIVRSRLARLYDLGCAQTNAPDGTLCQDGNACTSGDACESGTCVAGGPLVCDDGVFCNGMETCDPMTGCGFGVPVVCDDGIACTVDSCDEAINSCTHTLNNLACDDANICTDNVCTQTGCVSTNNSAPCDDSSSCTSGDVCRSGVCARGTTQPMPKTRGHYRRMCERSDLSLTDAACVAKTAPLTLADTDTLAEVCNQVNGHGTSQCTEGETDLLVLALNLCTGRICPSQPIDSQHGDNTTVLQSLAEADQVFSDPGRDEITCHHGRELAKEINDGTALGLNTLHLDKTPEGETLLTWTQPILGAGQSIVRHEVWRSIPGGDAFVLINTGTSTSYIDSAAGDFEYEVLFAIQD